MHERLARNLHQMPLGRDRVGGKAARVLEREVEHPLEQRGGFGGIEDQRVVGLNIEAAETEIGRAEQHLEGGAVFLGDEYFVVLQVPKMHALDVAAAGG